MQDVRLDMKAHVPQILFYIQDMNEVLKRTSHTSLYSSRILFKHFLNQHFFVMMTMESPKDFLLWIRCGLFCREKTTLRSLTDSIINQNDKVK